MEKIKWPLIISRIQDSECILLLGPEVCVTEEGKMHDLALLEHLKQETSEDDISYYDRDGMYFFRDRAAKNTSYYEIKQFYNKEFKDVIYSKLTRIPFHVIISTTPDHQINSVFQANNVKFKFEYYDKTQAQKDIKTPTKDEPLIYNLLGSKDKEESLIVTHDDMFDFLLSILGKHELPEKLRNELHSAKNFIFLGFKFHRWYVQLLLRKLDLHNENTRLMSYASSKDMNPETQLLIKDQFSITIVENQIEKFVDELYQKCDEEGILRKISATEERQESGVYNQVVELVEENNYTEALTLIKDYLRGFGNETSSNIITSLISQYNDLENENTAGNLSPNDYKTQKNQLRSSILKLNSQINQAE